MLIDRSVCSILCRFGEDTDEEKWNGPGREYCIWSIPSFDMRVIRCFEEDIYGWEEADADAWLLYRFAVSSILCCFRQVYFAYITNSSAGFGVMKGPDSNAQQCSVGFIHRQIHR